MCDQRLDSHCYCSVGIGFGNVRAGCCFVCDVSLLTKLFFLLLLFYFCFTRIPSTWRPSFGYKLLQLHVSRNPSVSLNDVCAAFACGNFNYRLPSAEMTKGSCTLRRHESQPLPTFPGSDNCWRTTDYA